jgi:lipopolysaccharide biosynthesis protein
MPLPKIFAIYFPQFHRTELNDQLWGDGFTEWHNVAVGTQLFKGHESPHLPGELGFYDLSDAQAVRRQIDLAAEHGIDGFASYHYWFSGRRVLSDPVDHLYAADSPMKLFLIWANESWTRSWSGAANEVILEQEFTEDDYKAHFYEVLPKLVNPANLRIEGKPVFGVYRMSNFPDPQAFMDCWQALAKQNGLKGIHFLGILRSERDFALVGNVAVDSWSEFAPEARAMSLHGMTLKKKFFVWIPEALRKYRVLSYQFVIGRSRDLSFPANTWPCVFPGWDNTARRRKGGGIVVKGSTPNLFASELRRSLQAASDKRLPVVLINAWNEWGEGNYLEPSFRNKRAYLEAVRQVCDEMNSQKVTHQSVTPYL